MATSAPIITSKGSSKNWRATKKNVLRIFNLFLEESRKQGFKYDNEPFEKMSHSVLCNTKLWEWFAGYLTQTYKKPARTKQGFVEKWWMLDHISDKKLFLFLHSR